MGYGQDMIDDHRGEYEFDSDARDGMDAETIRIVAGDENRRQFFRECYLQALAGCSSAVFHRTDESYDGRMDYADPREVVAQAEAIARESVILFYGEPA